MSPFFGPSHPGDGFFGPSAAAPPGSPFSWATSDWTLDELTSPHADRVGTVNLTSGGSTISRDGSKVSFTSGGATAGFITAADNTYYNANSWTCAVWYKTSTQTAGANILGMLPGDGNLGGWSLQFHPSVNSWLLFRSYQDDTNKDDASDFNTFATGTLGLIFCKYTRNGGGTNNVVTLRWTQDGATWRIASVTNAFLQRQSSTYKLRTDFNTGTTGSNPGEYHRIIFGNGHITTTTEDQAVWDAGVNAV